jgi:hypothetical protein
VIILGYLINYCGKNADLHKTIVCRFCEDRQATGKWRIRPTYLNPFPTGAMTTSLTIIYWI